MAQIKCDNVSYINNEKYIFKNISCEINAGDFVCVVGENGTGKSTLLEMISGISKVSSGEIIYSDGLVMRGIGYMPQMNSLNIEVTFRVKEMILAGYANRPGMKFFIGKEERKRASMLIKEMGIYSLRKKRINELSGGQQRKVLLCRALCSSNGCIVLDEPAAGLDPIAVEEMYNNIIKINNAGVTVIMVSADPLKGISVANKVLHLSYDEYFFGNKDEYMKTNFPIRLL